MAASVDAVRKPTPFRLARLLLAFAIVLRSLAAADSESLAYLEKLPAGNPCRTPLLQLERLPMEDRRAIQAWVNGPDINLTAPTTGRVIRTLNVIATQSAMLQAAVQHRFQILGHADASVPADPWPGDGSGFAVENTDDGGLILRSRCETAPGKPVTYKFAAPDAGFVRLP